ncbi:cold-shock protein [Pandoraea aquatica]|uniref:Cold-shock protein n=1 Tax=Pandoraea aquatica TaxID=2508290 RepID=A0A5E4YB32_9BURK|nr:cold shock domain-containing protein [Pandoraea aquatica]VVE45628.1 cold-shock protein [Pandoraea aquatica]
MARGTIKHINFDTEVGRITPDSGGTEIPFILAVVTGTDVKSLAVGQAVEYEW